MKADLHNHSNYSDGKFTPLEIIKEARSKGLKYFSITDHDNINAYIEGGFEKMQEEAREMKVIPGIEISTTYNGVGIEILIYNFDISKMKDNLHKVIMTVWEGRQFLFNEYSRILQENSNIEYDEDQFKLNEKVSSTFYNCIKEYKSNEKLLEGITDLGTFIRKGVYNPKSIFYIDFSKQRPSIEQVLRLGHEAGGICMLAHIFKYEFDARNEMENLLLSDYNGEHFDGIEAIYTSFTSDEENFAIDFASKNNLKISGGSDSHGKDDGYQIGNKEIPICNMTEWINKC